MRLHKYSIAILVSYGVFSLGLLATCLRVVAQVDEVLSASEALYVHPFAVSNAALDAKSAVADLRERTVFAVLSRDEAVVRAAREDEKSLSARFARDLDTIEANYLGDLQEVAAVRRLSEDWKIRRGQILDAAWNGDFDQAGELVLSSGTPAYIELHRTLEGIAEFARNKAAFLMNEARRQGARARNIVYATIFLGFAASFLAGLFVVRRVQRVVRDNEEILAHKANYDHLTGLPNRALFFDRLGQALEAAKRAQSLVAVMFIDLDGFKGINDRLGHEAGDELLVLAAGRLTSALRRSDTVARLGGDEFAVVIAGARGSEEIYLVADKIAARLNAMALVKGSPVEVRGSFGVAVFPRDGRDTPTLMAKADQAMYRAKSGAAGAAGAAGRVVPA
ncbi:MAG: diguanylate cyclase [Desulfovibrionaceae bacterium]|nr:diguanylate cyclase [Desulfovibrionaceae bacterium]MBF0513281.1 diguanylate cyclase [Desulfovibrionaceae bacterium]